MADNENTPPPAKLAPAKLSQAPTSPGKPCAVCGKPMVARYKPFCSARCADIDLGRWLKGSYVIPGEAVDEAETGKPETDEER